MFGIASTAQNPPARRRASAGVDVLDVLEPRRAQVHVRVDERRHDDEPGGIDELGFRGRLERAGLPELGHPAGAHEHVSEAVEPDAGIEQASAAQERIGRGAGRVVELDRRRAHAG